MIQIGKRREAYTFTDRTHPKEGIFSVITGALLFLCFLVLFLVTSMHQGGKIIGVLGILIFFGAIGGIWLSMRGMKKEDIYYRFPIIGIVLNGIVIVMSVSLYFIGLASNISIG